MKTNSIHSPRILFGSIATALLALVGTIQANTVTLSNGTNSAAIPTNVTDIFTPLGVSSSGTLILNNYQLFGNQGNGNASCGFGLGSSNNTFTLTNGSFFAFGGTTYPAGYGNTGYGSPLNWGAAGGAWSCGTSNNTLNIQTGSTLAIGRRFCWTNNISNQVNVDGTGSKFINSNPSNTNPVGGTWAITNGGSVFMANVGYSASSTFNATIGGTDPSGYGSTWHSVGGFNGLNNAANIVTINSGGFLEFEGQGGAAPAPAFSISSGAVNISGGGLSYGLPQNSQSYSGDLLGSNAGSTANTIGGFNWTGNNRFRINGGTAGITDNGTADYTFANNLGSKNYYSLDLVGTASISSRHITLDGNNGGGMLLSGATASVTGLTTLLGNVTIKADNTPSTFAGVIDGSGGLILSSSTLTNASTLTLSSSNTYLGNTQIDRGTLSISNAFLNDNADVLIASGAFFNLNTGGATDTIDELFLGGTQQASGIYGAVGSGAAHETAFITGSGKLNVVTGSVPEPGAAVSLLGGLGLLLGVRRRRA